MSHSEIELARDALRQIQLFWHLDESEIDVRRLGGLTNLVYRVDHGGEQYVLRLPGKGTEEYINRANEAQAAKEAARVGVSPDVVYVDVPKGILVTRLVDGAVTMSAEKFKSIAGAPGRAGAVLRKLHGTDAVFDFRFELFAMIDEYRKIFSTNDIARPPG